MYKTAVKICKEEGGDEDITGAAALLHDLQRSKIGKNDKTDLVNTIKKARKILIKCRYSSNKIDKILMIIEEHSINS